MIDIRIVTWWSALAGAGWTLAGYAAALRLLPRRDWKRSEAVPPVTIIVPAFREREQLASKLRALDALDYPQESVQIIVAVDEDEVTARMAQAASPRATVVFSALRRGKAAALNTALDDARGEIVIMTDANNVLAPESVRQTVRHFADASVSGVAGRRGEAGSPYDRYEDLLRRLESRSGSVAAMSGEFMAVRRSALSRIPDNVVNDDLWLLCELVREGGRVVYEPDAYSIEPPLAVAAEISRRARIGAGRAMLVSALRGLPPGYQWRLLSHKFGRLALPWMLLGLLLSSTSLVRRRPYRDALLAQIAFYAFGGAAAAGWRPSGRTGVLAGAARQFVLGNVATAFGVVRALRRRQRVTWEAVR